MWAFSMGPTLKKDQKSDLATRSPRGLVFGPGPTGLNALVCCESGAKRRKCPPTCRRLALSFIIIEMPRKPAVTLRQHSLSSSHVHFRLFASISFFVNMIARSSKYVIDWWFTLPMNRLWILNKILLSLRLLFYPFFRENITNISFQNKIV